MNPSQKRVLLRLGSMSLVLLLGYVMIILYLQSTIPQTQRVEAVLLISLTYIGLLILLWIRERNLYYDYTMERRINTGKVGYMLCPSCKSIQRQGLRRCKTCGEIWISCKVCRIPFEPGSSVLISPCCGEGFHPEHFEVALRELSHCPYCLSDLALNTSNW